MRSTLALSLLLFALAATTATWSHAAGLAPGPAGAAKSTAPAWPVWSKGFEAGVRSIGLYRAETTAVTDAPAGGPVFQMGAHAWYNHLVEAHAVLGFGVNNLILTYGLGVRANLFSFESGPGLLAPLIKNFMLFGELSYQHYTFPDTDAALNTYTGTSWALQKGLGVQYYVGIPTPISRTFYVEMSISTTGFGSSTYYMPYIGIGMELRSSGGR